MRGNGWVSCARTDGSRPRPARRSSADFTPRKPNRVKTRRPPGPRCAGAPSITRASSRQPSGPPLSAAAAASLRSRSGGVGICGGLVAMRSNVIPRTGSKPSPRRTLTRAATPFTTPLSPPPPPPRGGGDRPRPPPRGQHRGETDTAADLEHPVAGPHRQVTAEQEGSGLGRLHAGGHLEGTASGDEQQEAP